MIIYLYYGKEADKIIVENETGQTCEVEQISGLALMSIDWQRNEGHPRVRIKVECKMIKFQEDETLLIL